jgi:EAL domain-containing protein (putative c-di-GMP-specific phosphodiesterase class I)
MLGKRIVAEGVESEAQLAFLRNVGCDAAQGFLLARPQTAEQVVHWFSGANPSRSLSPGESARPITPELM